MYKPAPSMVVKVELWVSNEDKPIRVVPFAELIIKFGIFTKDFEIIFKLPYDIAEDYYTSFKSLHIMNYSYGVNSYDNLITYLILPINKTKLITLDKNTQSILF